MFDPNVITTTTQQTQIQYQQQQQQQQTDKDKTGQDQKQDFAPFCYANVNMIQKITPQTQHSTVNMSQLTDDKCYITQPAFSYNYTLVST